MTRIAAAFLTLMLMSSSAAAETVTDDAERLATEGLSKILKALDLIMNTVPQYAAPEVMPNGDIIIRRLNPDDQPPPRDDDAPSDGTET